MSWFTEIAGKAEKMLDKLDKNAAAALSADVIERSFSSVIPIEDDHHEPPTVTQVVTNSSPEPAQAQTLSPRKSALAQLRGTRSNMLKATRRKPAQDEEKNLLMSYLNSPSPSLDLLDSKDKLQDSKRNHIPDSQDGQHLKTENTFLKSEIQSLNFEISRLLQKAKQAEKDQQELITRQARITELESSLHVSRNECQRISKELQELKLLKSESHFELSSEIERLSQSLKEHEAQTSTLAESHARIEKERSEIQSELSELKDNFEKYRARAQSVLNEKDNLIGRLRSGAQEDEAAEQLENEEIVLLRQGSQQLSSELASLRSTLGFREEEKVQMTRSLIESQAALEALGQRYATVENELSFHKEESQRLREDLMRAQSEIEAQRVLEQTPTPAPTKSWPQQNAHADYVLDLDSKVRTLTATLVKKQQAVELLTAERNAMRLQLEKTENKLQDVSRMYNMGTLSDMNSSDDVKARLAPGSLRERLGLGEVTFPRGVRKAYTALGVASSVMRRHPIMRLCLAAYLMILHLWVICVLLSSTPESTSKTPNPH